MIAEKRKQLKLDAGKCADCGRTFDEFAKFYSKLYDVSKERILISIHKSHVYTKENDVLCLNCYQFRMYDRRQLKSAA